MNEIKNIADVIAALDVILQDMATKQNRTGYFAALYKRMTVAVRDGIINGNFEDGPRMEALDVVFAKRYLSAYHAYNKGHLCSAAWQCAFNSSGNQSLIVLQHLLLGINTHINLDLAIAAATVAPGEKIHALEGDFNRINSVIEALVDDIQKCLEEVWWPMRLLRNVVNNHGNAVLNFSISAARKAAWTNAVLLANMDASAQAAHIAVMDKAVCALGDRIMHPGPWPQLLLRLLRLTEHEDVTKTIRLIDTTVVD